MACFPLLRSATLIYGSERKRAGHFTVSLFLWESSALRWCIRGFWWCWDVADARAHCRACVGLWGPRLCDVKWVKQGCYWEQSGTPLGILFAQLLHNRLILLIQHTVRAYSTSLCQAHMEHANLLLSTLHIANSTDLTVLLTLLLILHTQLIVLVRNGFIRRTCLAKSKLPVCV